MSTSMRDWDEMRPGGTCLVDGHPRPSELGRGTLRREVKRGCLGHPAKPNGLTGHFARVIPLIVSGGIRSQLAALAR